MVGETDGVWLKRVTMRLYLPTVLQVSPRPRRIARESRRASRQQFEGGEEAGEGDGFLLEQGGCARLLIDYTEGVSDERAGGTERAARGGELRADRHDVGDGDNPAAGEVAPSAGAVVPQSRGSLRNSTSGPAGELGEDGRQGDATEFQAGQGVGVSRIVWSPRRPLALSTFVECKARKRRLAATASKPAGINSRICAAKCQAPFVKDKSIRPLATA